MKTTRKRELLQQLQRVGPWAALLTLITPFYPEGRTGRSPFALEAMLCVHFLQQWFSLSDPAMEEASFDVLLYRGFAQSDATGRMPDESTILRFRHRLEKHMLADSIVANANNVLGAQVLLLRQGSAVDAALIAAPSSTKNRGGKRNPEMHSGERRGLDKANVPIDALIDNIERCKGIIRARVKHPFCVIKRYRGLKKNTLPLNRVLHLLLEAAPLRRLNIEVHGFLEPLIPLGTTPKGLHVHAP